MKSIGLFIILVWVGFPLSLSLIVGSYYDNETIRCNNKEASNVY